MLDNLRGSSMRKKDRNLVVIEYIHLLDLPTYVLDEKGNRKELAVIKPDGIFTMASTKGLPTQFDNKVLYYLLTQIIRDGEIFTHEVRTTRYAVATAVCGRKIKDTHTFNRIIEALKKYKHTTFDFEGKFYSQDEETVRCFSYIDDVIFNKKTKELYVNFNQQYMALIKESGFIKYINFDVYNSLGLPVSARLYEILCKSLEFNSSWSIGLQNLAEKMTLQKRSKAKGYYASDVLAKIKPGIGEISKKSPLKIEFTYNKASDVVTFKRTKAAKSVAGVVPAKKTTMKVAEPKPEPVQSKKEIAECFKYFKALSVDEQEEINTGIEKNDFIKWIPDHESKVFAYLTAKKLWHTTHKHIA
jgi:hypothetical protein